MGSVRELILFSAAFAVSAAAVACLAHLAPQRGWLAAPNARSLHSRPKPTLGGLGFALPILGFLGYAGLQAAEAAWLAVAAAGIGLTGLLDDLRELGRGLRLTVQFAAAGLVLWLLPPGWPPWVLALAALLLIWQVNLFNFMDGIDGLAAGACLFFCLGAQLLSGGVPGWLGELLWLTAGAMLGFLCFNWPPAKIMMGDSGSTLLGLLLGASVLLLKAQDVLPLAACLILLTGLWFDASYTLCVRIATGQAFTQAHRSHLYQKVAARRGHLWTTSAFLAFCLVWLLPLAYLAKTLPALGWLWQLAALLPLAVAAPLLRAGLPDEGRIALDS